MTAKRRTLCNNTLMASYDLSVPISAEEARSLSVGDSVRLSGVLLTARDAAHRYLVDTLIAGAGGGTLSKNDQKIYDDLLPILQGGLLYHCGPVVRQVGGGWEFVAAGPTTSARLEQYEAQVISHFGLRGVIGKGGMGRGTLEALKKCGAVYLHAVGGAASLIAGKVDAVLNVYKLKEFGVPEAMWLVRVTNMPAVVTMDSHGHSLHSEVEQASKAILQRLLKK